MSAEPAAPKRRGRPTGKTGPRPGSRPYTLARMKPGDRLFFEAPAGKVASFMQQVGTDIQRGGHNGKITQTHVLGIAPSTREVIEIVMLTCLGNKEIEE